MVVLKRVSKSILNIMLTLLLTVPVLEVAEARAPTRTSSIANGLGKLKSIFMPRQVNDRAVEYSTIQKLIAGAGLALVVCTTGSLVSCGGKKMMHSSEPLIAQFTNAELEVGDYVHVRIDGESHTALILGQEEQGLQVEVFSEGFEGEGGTKQTITADQVVGTNDIFHADNGKQVLLHSLDLSRAKISAEDAKRFELSGFRSADMIYWHGIITTKFSDGSMEVMIGSKIYVNHPNGVHNQMVVQLEEPVFTLAGEDNLVVPPYQ